MRKNIFLNEPSDLDGKEKLTAVNSPRIAPLGARGAVGAMRDSLAEMSGPSPENAVIELATDLIDDSFVPDRMEGTKEDHDTLVVAIREQGQLVPVLLRPKPDDPRRFQVAYGHRRVRALRELGKPVRAVVRALTDEELVVAQGQENNARRDLSFIEKAAFAVALEDRGFDREKTIIPALSVDKTELSRLISVARAISPEIIEAIGPAPKTGRRRWMELAERLDAPKAGEIVRRLMATQINHLFNSDDRFIAMLTAVTPQAKPAKRKGHTWKDERGRSLARIERGQGRFVLSIDENIEPAFGEYLESRLTEIFRDFASRNDESTALSHSQKEG
jgi:ParB family chromosome partitioning protein